MSAEPGGRHPVVIAIALLPLTLLVGWAIWWGVWVASGQPHVVFGRSCELLLVAGSLWAAWLAWRQPRMAATAWGHPAVWCLAALLWQCLALAWAPVREPGLIWLGERAAGLALAFAVAASLRCADGARAALALMAAGLGILFTFILCCIEDWTLVYEVLRDAPFGNPNFAVGAAMPLAAAGIVLILWPGGCTAAGIAPSRRWLWILLACTGLALFIYLIVNPFKHPSKMGLAALLTGLGGALALRLGGRRSGTWLAIGGAGIVVGLVIALLGWLDDSILGISIDHRVRMWWSGLEALRGPAALFGWGPGASIVALQVQPSSAEAWVFYRAYAEQAHNEYLQAMLDGGLVNAGLLGLAVVATLRPLWRRRADPVCAALMVGWIVAGTLALLDVHLSQPGGVLCLGLLAGVSWAVADHALVEPPERIRHAVWAGCLVAALAVGTIGVRDFIPGGGTPEALRVKTGERAKAAIERGDLWTALAAYDELRSRLGPLEGVDRNRTRMLGKLKRHGEASEVLAGQLDRLPCDYEALALARRMIEQGLASPRLVEERQRAVIRGLAIMARVPRRGISPVLLRRIDGELATPVGLRPRDRRGDPAPEP